MKSNKSMITINVNKLNSPKIVRMEKIKTNKKDRLCFRGTKKKKNPPKNPRNLKYQSKTQGTHSWRTLKAGVVVRQNKL